jgi:hypothetical protein
MATVILLVSDPTTCRNIRLTEPVVDPEVGKQVPDSQVGEAPVLVDPVESTEGDGETNITQENELGILGLEEWGRWVEVVDTGEVTVLLAISATLWLTLVVVVAGNVRGEVHQPSTELLGEHVDSGSNWGLLSQFVELVNQSANTGSVDLTSLWHENHVTLHVAGSLVVLAVGDLPREVRHKESRVADPADSVVESLGWGECLVTALVGHNPQTGAEKTLKDGVESPQSSTNGGRLDVFWSYIVVENVESGGQAGNITSHVGKTADGGTVKAVLWNGIADIVDGVVWNLKLVAVGVEKDTVWLFLLDIVRRGHRA